MLWLCRIAVVVFGIGLVPQALAQTAGADFNLERFRPALDRHGLLDVESGELRRHLDLDLGFVGGYALNPLVVVDGNGRAGALVAHRLTGHLALSLGLFDLLSVGLEVPTTLYQTADASGLANAFGVADAASVTLGDVRVMPKLQLLRRDFALVDLALMTSISLPTALPRGSWSGEDGVTFTPELALSRPFLAGGRLRTAINVGYRLRPAARIGDLEVGQEVTWRAAVGLGLHDLVGVPVEVAISGNGGIATTRQQGKIGQNPAELAAGVTWDVLELLQVYGAVGGGVVAGFGTPDLRVFGGVRLGAPSRRDRDGDGIADGRDACVDVAEDKDGFQDDDGCPELDNDGDGVLDADDRCPLEAEDRDGFKDDDGCPEADNDEDGISDADDGCPLAAEDRDTFEDSDGCPDTDNDRDGLLDADDRCPLIAGLPVHRGCPPPDRDGDTVPDDADACPDVAGLPGKGGCPDTDGDGIVDPKDRCPTEAEVINGVDDEDGCPDKGVSRVIITKTRIEILEKVYFDVNKATIQRRSHNLLRQVAAVLKNNSQLTKIRIEGHTDSDGSDKANLELSQRRTDSVKRFLIAEGVATERLDAVGFGESRPTVENTTKANKEMNRRVEFRIVEVDGKAVDDG